MQRVSVRAPSSSPLAVSVGDASSCSPVTIGWDASKGKGPWTVMVAPINQTPVTLSIPDASGSNFQYDWTAPLYSSRTSTQAFVAVSDSTGSASGVSSQILIGPSSKKCDAAEDSLDFVWYPTETKGSPEQCTDWGITYQKDNKDNGIEGQVTFTFLPERGSPVTVSAGPSTSKGGSFEWTIPWTTGTKFGVIANDEGKSRTGGVGDVYTVAAGGSKAPNSCTTSGNLGNGLPDPTSTFLAASTATPSSTGKAGTGTSSTGKGAPSTGASTNNDAAGQQSTETSKSGSSRAGVAVGATFGVLAVIALVVGLLWYLRKRSRQNEDYREEKDPGQGITPWRWSSSPYDGPVTNGRSSKWFRKGGVSPSRGFKVLGERPGHSTSNSISTSFKAPFTNAHVRNQSSFSQGGSESFHSVQSPFGSNGRAPSFRNVVPDDALFPPPRPRMMPDERSFAAQRTLDGDRLGTPVASRGAGLGTYDSMTRDGAGQDEIAPQNYAPTPSYRKNPPIVDRSKEETPVSPSNGYIGPIGPTKTSIYDPYTHLSHIWEDQDGVTREIQQAGNHAYSNHDSSGVTSEVMMCDSSSIPAPRSDSDRYSHQSGELPYL